MNLVFRYCHTCANHSARGAVSVLDGGKLRPGVNPNLKRLSKTRKASIQTWPSLLEACQVRIKAFHVWIEAFHVCMEPFQVWIEAFLVWIEAFMVWIEAFSGLD